MTLQNWTVWWLSSLRKNSLGFTNLPRPLTPFLTSLTRFKCHRNENDLYLNKNKPFCQHLLKINCRQFMRTSVLALFLFKRRTSTHTVHLDFQSHKKALTNPTQYFDSMNQRVWELLAVYSNRITTLEVGVVIHDFSVLFILLFLRERKKISI